MGDMPALGGERIGNACLQREGSRQTQPFLTFNEERRSLDSRFTLPACSTTGTCGDKQATMPIAGDPNYN